MTKQIALGIDIGGTLTKVGIVDRAGEIYEHVDFSTAVHKDFSRVSGCTSSKT